MPEKEGVLKPHRGALIARGSVERPLYFCVRDAAHSGNAPHASSALTNALLLFSKFFFDSRRLPHWGTPSCGVCSYPHLAEDTCPAAL